MTTIVPLQAVPAQKLYITLGGQNVGISIYMIGERLYLDLALNDDPIITSVICQDRVNLISEESYGFSGNLAFIDTQGKSDPEYTGLGSRYLLAYLS